jgi:hypothetical protein
MKREIPLIGLVLVLALLLIIPIFQVISTHAFVCNISTVLSNVGGCYVYITAKIYSSLQHWPYVVCCRNQQFLITEKNIVGSLYVLVTGHTSRYTNPFFYPPTWTYLPTSFICVYGYLFVAGNLTNNYIKPFAYTGYDFLLPVYSRIFFYCLSVPPKSLYYLATLGNTYMISCFYTSLYHYYLYYSTIDQFMLPFFGFRLPVDDIFYYILDPSLFCGSTIIATPQTMTNGGHGFITVACTKIVSACIGFSTRHTLVITCIWGCVCTFVIPGIEWEPLTITTTVFTICLGGSTEIGHYCLINTFLRFLPTKTISCSLVLPFCAFHMYGSLSSITIIIRSFVGHCCVIHCFCEPYITITWIGWRTATFHAYGGVLINQLPYCTEYFFYYKLCSISTAVVYC